MEDWKKRLVEEYKQLTKRIIKLRLAIIEIEEVDTTNIANEDYQLMKNQFNAMHEYRCCLMRRAVRNNIELADVLWGEE